MCTSLVALPPPKAIMKQSMSEVRVPFRFLLDSFYIMMFFLFDYAFEWKLSFAYRKYFYLVQQIWPRPRMESGSGQNCAAGVTRRYSGFLILILTIGVA